MNRTAGIFSTSSERNSEGTLCRLCMKNNDYYFNIFTSNVACRMTVKDAINGLLGLEVAVGDGLPTTLCPLCLKKLTEFSVFKMTCLQSDAKLRKLSGRNCFRSIQWDETADDKLGTPADTKDFIQDEIDGTSHLTCSAQRTEIYIPVEDSQQLGSNMLVSSQSLEMMLPKWTQKYSKARKHLMAPMVLNTMHRLKNIKKQSEIPPHKEEK